MQPTFLCKNISCCQSASHLLWGTEQRAVLDSAQPVAILPKYCCTRQEIRLCMCSSHPLAGIVTDNCVALQVQPKFTLYHTDIVPRAPQK